ncbi:MAG TPA: hypothetical protein VF707_10730 [Ardenticatenaceae bacterium]
MSLAAHYLNCSALELARAPLAWVSRAATAAECEMKTVDGGR